MSAAIPPWLTARKQSMQEKEDKKIQKKMRKLMRHIMCDRWLVPVQDNISEGFHQMHCLIAELLWIQKHSYNYVSCLGQISHKNQKKNRKLYYIQRQIKPMLRSIIILVTIKHTKHKNFILIIVECPAIKLTMKIMKQWKKTCGCNVLTYL